MMLTASLTSGGDPHRCTVCGKESPIQPCWPLGDAACANCGCLLFFQPLAGPRLSHAGLESERHGCYEMLPDTLDNHENAAKVVAELERLWENHKDRRAKDISSAQL